MEEWNQELRWLWLETSRLPVVGVAVAAVAAGVRRDKVVDQNLNKHEKSKVCIPVTLANIFCPNEIFSFFFSYDFILTKL